MDEVDFAILRELVWVPTDPAHRARGIQRPWDVARTLGLHGNTVKRRMEEMTRSGVLAGVHAIPLPKALGLHCSVYLLRYSDPDRKRAAIARLRTWRGASGYSDYLGEELWAGFLGFAPADLPATASAFATETRADGFRHLFDLAWPREGDALGPLDHRILRGFAGDAHRSLDEVAGEVGITRKTLAARLDRLLDSGAFCVRPQVNLGFVRGLVPFVLAAEVPPGNREAHARLLSAFPDAFDRSTPEAPFAFLYLHAPDLRGIPAALDRARAVVPEATGVRALLLHEVGPCEEGIRALLAEAPSSPERAGAPAAQSA